MKTRLHATAGALVLMTTACGGVSSSRTVQSKPGQFRLDEWSITGDRPVLKQGRQTITATNIGHHTHELVIVKAADVPGGASLHKSFNLRPGSYVVFCNIVGWMGMENGMMGGMEHVHFDAGMHTEFTVSA